MYEIPVFIGHDHRQPENSMVCRHSLEARGPVKVHFLNHLELRKKGLFTRPWFVDSGGQMWDQRDGRPFSTEFAHSRFLVPHIAREMGYERAVFVDSDFVFLRNIKELVEEAEGPVAVAKHDYRPTSTTKFLGAHQGQYVKKLWSSLMVFDLTKFKGLDPHRVNTMPGDWLHDFRWVDEIGSVRLSWNYIPRHSKGDMLAIHYTEGSPAIPEYRDSILADIWLQEYQDAKRYIW